MTELLRSWIMALTTACIVTSCAVCLSPKGPVKRVTQLVCAVALTALLLQPLTELDLDAYSLSLAKYRDATARLTGELEAEQQRLSRVYIQEECAAYILDEARSLGMEGRVEVRARWRDDCWVPYSAELYFPGAQRREELSVWLKSQLGIPAERQVWHDGG